MTQHERHLHKDRKKALAVLFMQVLVIIGYIACLAANAQKFSAVGLALMFLLVAILLILSFIGFNAIFYLDQGKLGLFKILNIIAIILFVAFHIMMLLFMKSDDYVSEYGDDYAGEFIISSVILTVIVLLDILMISLIRSLSTKWRRASEKSQIKSAVFDRMSYENILQTSLLLENNDAKKSRYSNTGK